MAVEHNHDRWAGELLQSAKHRVALTDRKFSVQLELVQVEQKDVNHNWYCNKANN